MRFVSQPLSLQYTNGSTTYSYVYNGNQLSQMTVGSNTLSFYYASGTPMAVLYNGEYYYYVTNQQGDVIKILDDTGMDVVMYDYNAWGEWVCGGRGAGIEFYNPLCYRGYVYDHETGFYYLQSRYYDPEIGRFINADGYASTGQGILGNNMFAYCGNNPIKHIDPEGTFICTIIGGIVGGIAGGISAYLNGENIKAGVLIGLTTGALAGAAADVAIATGGIGGIAIAAVGGAFANSANYVLTKVVNNQSVDAGDLAIEASIGASFNVLTFGLGGGSLAKETGKILTTMVKNTANTVLANTTRKVAGVVVRKSIPGVVKNITKNIAYEVTTTVINWVSAYAIGSRYKNA